MSQLWAPLPSSGGGAGTIGGLLGDTGTEATPDVNGNVTIAGGSNINTSSPGVGSDTVTVNLNDAISWPDTNAALTEGAIHIDGKRFLYAYGTDNTMLGKEAGNTALTGTGNTFVGRLAGYGSAGGSNTVAIGYQAFGNAGSISNSVAIGAFVDPGSNLGADNVFIGYRSAHAARTTGSGESRHSNVAVGSQALRALTIGIENVAIGRNALAGLSNGDSNTAIGFNAGAGILDGGRNVFVGYKAGESVSTSTTQCILIGANVVSGSSNTIRIGNPPDINDTFIAGIYGNTIGSDAGVVMVDDDHKLGASNGSNGQILIGGGTKPVWANITSTDSSVTITNGANSIDLSASGGSSFTWNIQTGASVNMVVNNGYIANRSGATLAALLPATAAVGDVVRVTGIDNATGWRITQNAGQIIYLGTSSTTTGTTGYLESTAIRDSVDLVCVVANTTWNVLSVVGNITVS